MRQLHPVGWQERFVAGGVYAESVGGQPTGETEQWTIHELPDGARLIRAEIQTSALDVFTLIEAWCPAHAALVERIDLQAHRGSAATLRASYHIAPDRIDFTLGDQHASLPLPDDARVDAGAVILRSVPTIRGRLPLAVISPHAPVPEVRFVTVEPVGSEIVALGAESIAARVYNVAGMGDALCTLWLDDHDVVLKMVQAQRTLQLAQYVRRPEPRHHD
jgi:hypothetical protein